MSLMDHIDTHDIFDDGGLCPTAVANLGSSLARSLTYTIHCLSVSLSLPLYCRDMEGISNSRVATT